MGVLDAAPFKIKKRPDQKNKLPCTPEGGELYPRSLLAVLVLALLPAGVILLTMVAGGKLDLSTDAKSTLSQLAGGALLVTYLSELFKSESLLNLRETRAGAWKCMPLFSKWGVAALGFVAGVLIQKALDDGIVWTNPPGPTDRIARHESTGQNRGQMIPFVVGFVTDGIVIAFCTSTCKDGIGIFGWRRPGGKCTAGEVILALVFSIDNAIDGLGLSPKANLLEKNGSTVWGIVFCVAVFAGAVIGYGLRRFFGLLMRHHLTGLSSHLEIGIKVGVMTSILLGALELMPHGLTGAVLTGFIVVWFVLFVGERLEVVQYNLYCCCKYPIPLYDPITCTE